MENNKRVIVRATEKYEFCCYLSDMGVERIYTVLAENEKDARKRFHELLNGEQVELLQIRKVMRKDERRKLLYRLRLDD